MKKWQVTENNGGGLTLYVWDDDNKLIYAHAGYEFAPDALRADITALRNGDDTSEWEGNDLDNEDIISAIRRQDFESQNEYDNDGNRRGDFDPTSIYDDDGNLIPLTDVERAGYYDDHPSTRVICSQDGRCGIDDMGRAGQEVFEGWDS